MFCVRCGAVLPGAAAFCPSCGTPVLTGPAPDPTGPARSAYPASPEAGTSVAPGIARYGGFWRRFWSHVIDRFLLGVALAPLGLLLLVPLAADPSSAWADSDLAPGMFAAFVGAVLSLTSFAVLVTWLYHATLQSSPRQATLGQWALGLRVTDLEGRRASFARATGRYFATILTGLTFGLGYLMVLFTARRQTLHDLIAGTLVVR